MFSHDTPCFLQGSWVEKLVFSDLEYYKTVAIPWKYQMLVWIGSGQYFEVVEGLLLHSQGLSL